jgi:hypothetical protein
MRRRRIQIILVLLTITFLSVNVFGQGNRSKPQELGINLLQIPATTIDLTYTLSLKPNFSVLLNTGYTFNYDYSIDFIGFLLSPHSKCGNLGYDIINQSGGYLKLGMSYNFRRKFDKNNYFFFGGYLSGSLVYEKSEYTDMVVPNSSTQEQSHSVFLYGLSGFLGYNFKLSEKLNADFGVQISVPSKAYEDLYGSSNFIPGMGYMDTCGGGRIFPLVFFNLKYILK